MHHFITLWRVIKAGLINFFRNTWLSTAATAVMLVTLTIMLSSIIINLILSQEIKNIVEDITVSVYFEDESTEEQRAELEKALRQEDNVQNVTYISKEQALRNFTESISQSYSKA